MTRESPGRWVCDGRACPGSLQCPVQPHLEPWNQGDECAGAAHHWAWGALAPRGAAGNACVMSPFVSSLFGIVLCARDRALPSGSSHGSWAEPGSQKCLKQLHGAWGPTDAQNIPMLGFGALQHDSTTRACLLRVAHGMCFSITLSRAHRTQEEEAPSSQTLIKLA